MSSFEQVVNFNNRKKARTHKDQAEKQCEKRIKEYAKRQQKIEQAIDVKPMPHRPSTVLADLKHKLWSSSQGNLKQIPKEQTSIANGTKFSTLVGGTISAPRGPVQRKAQAIRAKLTQGAPQADEFKIAEIDQNGKRSVRSLQGVRRDSEVIYVGTYSSNGDLGKRGKIADVFDMDETSEMGEFNSASEAYKTLSRSVSQPDFLSRNDDDEISEEVMMQRPSGLFDRPMLGSLAFR